MKALIKYAFEELGVRRIIAKCDPKNHNSWKLLERVGMRREGTLLQNVYFFTDENNNPIWKDTYEYAVLKDEYKAENIKHNIEEKMQYKITSIPSENDKKEIYEELLKYNLAHIENKDVKELGIFLENEEGKKVAGLIGDTHGNWLTIDYLWVDENLRGKDIGREIIKKAEIEARNRGCKYSFLNTFEFQAEGFYLKLGYKKVFSLEEYPVTGKRHYLIKKL